MGDRLACAGDAAVAIASVLGVLTSRLFSFGGRAQGSILFHRVIDSAGVVILALDEYLAFRGPIQIPNCLVPGDLNRFPILARQVDPARGERVAWM